jgi:hypothetical protein
MKRRASPEEEGSIKEGAPYFGDTSLPSLADWTPSGHGSTKSVLSGFQPKWPALERTVAGPALRSVLFTNRLLAGLGHSKTTTFFDPGSMELS